MATESKVSVVEETYRCPYCQLTLEARTNSGGKGPWLRCPDCGRASRVPDQVMTFPAVTVIVGDEVKFVDESPLATPEAAAAAWSFKAVARPQRPRSALRVVYTASLFVFVTLLLFMLVERNTYGVTVCIGGAIIGLGLLVRSSRW